MLNQVVLVGRLTADPEIVITDNNNKRTVINLAVQRAFKNMDGIYESDFIRCVLWNSVATNTYDYCHTGDIVGVKGRLQTSSYEDENNHKHYITEVVAERITFLSSKPKEENEIKKSSKKKKTE